MEKRLDRGIGENASTVRDVEKALEVDNIFEYMESLGYKRLEELLDKIDY